jgi:lyso-ornithine lipid O-acyltransferase
MKTLRRISRYSLLIGYALMGVLLTLLMARTGEGGVPTPRFFRIIQWWHHGLCRALGLDIRVKGTPHAGSALVVANHISWLDIHILGGLAPLCFVSKAEVSGWPLIGWFSRVTGTVFIQRGARGAAEATSREMETRLQAGAKVALFPEGTTSDGSDVRRFHSRLFHTAVATHRPVQPVAITYPHPEGVNPVAPFIDDQSLLDNLWHLTGEKRIQVEVNFLPLQDTHGASRTDLAAHAHTIVRAVVHDGHQGSQRG